MLSLSSCGEKIPQLNESKADSAESSAAYSAADDAEDTADGQEDVFTVYDADGDDEAYAEISAAEVAEAWNELPDPEPATGMTDGYVGGFAFSYDADSWDALAQPGVGYQLTYRAAEDCACQIMMSVETIDDIDTVMAGVFSMYEGEAEFDTADEELGGLPVKRARGSTETDSMEMLFSQPEEDGEVLVVQCIITGASEQAERAAAEVLSSFSLRLTDNSTEINSDLSHC